MRVMAWEEPLEPVRILSRLSIPKVVPINEP